MEMSLKLCKKHQRLFQRQSKKVKQQHEEKPSRKEILLIKSHKRGHGNAKCKKEFTRRTRNTSCIVCPHLCCNSLAVTSKKLQFLSDSDDDTAGNILILEHKCADNTKRTKKNRGENLKGMIKNLEEEENSRRKSKTTKIPPFSFEPFDEDVVSLISNLPPAPIAEIPVIGPKLDTNKRYTVVLDLDHTLIHASTEINGNYDFTIEVRERVGNNTIKLGIKKRPFCDQFLRELSRHFEVIGFTAGTKFYADSVLRNLDPKKEIFSYMLWRDACFAVHSQNTNQIHYIKNLQILHRNLDTTILIDNSLEAFGFQLDNGMLVPSYYGESENDNVLPQVLELLLDMKKRNAKVNDFCGEIFGIGKTLENWKKKNILMIQG